MKLKDIKNKVDKKEYGVKSESKKIKKFVLPAVVVEKEKTRKPRSANFSICDKTLLIELVSSRINIIDNKVTDAAMLEKKKKEWMKIEKEFNATAQTKRSVDALKTCYDNLKKIARKEKSDEGVEMLKTGGGKSTKCVSELSQKLIGLNQPLYSSLSNKYDSDAKFVEATNNYRAQSSATVKYEVVIDDNYGPEFDYQSPLSNAAAQPHKIGLQSPIINLSRKKKTVHLRDINRGIIPGTSATMFDPPQGTSSGTGAMRPELLIESITRKLAINQQEASKKNRAYDQTEVSSDDELPKNSDNDRSFNLSEDNEVEGVHDEEVAMEEENEEGEGEEEEEETVTPKKRTRRQGSHVLASKKFANLADKKMQFYDLKMKNEIAKHNVEMSILEKEKETAGYNLAFAKLRYENFLNGKSDKF